MTERLCARPGYAIAGAGGAGMIGQLAIATGMVLATVANAINQLREFVKLRADIMSGTLL